MASLDQEAASKAAAGMLEKVKARATELWEKPLAEDPRVDKAIKGAIESYSTYLPPSPPGPFLFCSPARGVTWWGNPFLESKRIAHYIAPGAVQEPRPPPFFLSAYVALPSFHFPSWSTGGRPT